MNTTFAGAVNRPPIVTVASPSVDVTVLRSTATTPAAASRTTPAPRYLRPHGACEVNVCIGYPQTTANDIKSSLARYRTPVSPSIQYGRPKSTDTSAFATAARTASPFSPRGGSVHVATSHPPPRGGVVHVAVSAVSQRGGAADVSIGFGGDGSCVAVHPP